MKKFLKKYPKIYAIRYKPNEYDINNYTERRYMDNLYYTKNYINIQDYNLRILSTTTEFIKNIKTAANLSKNF